MSVGIITLSAEGWRVARALSRAIPEATVYLHQNVPADDGEAPERFDRVGELTRSVFGLHWGLVYVMPCGVVVRAIASLVSDKHTDSAVVVMDVGARHAVSLLSGHEGGANRLAVQVANATGAEPVITTTTEARKDLVVGVGCRRGMQKDALVDAITDTLRNSGLALERVRLLATADVKRDENGLFEAADVLGVPLVLVPSGRIRAFAGAFQASDLVQQSVGLPAVAEPSAMLAGKNTSLIVRKTRCNGITIAMARESSLSSE